MEKPSISFTTQSVLEELSISRDTSCSVTRSYSSREMGKETVTVPYSGRCPLLKTAWIILLFRFLYPGASVIRGMADRLLHRCAFFIIWMRWLWRGHHETLQIGQKCVLHKVPAHRFLLSNQLVILTKEQQKAVILCRITAYGYILTFKILFISCSILKNYILGFSCFCCNLQKNVVESH